MQTLASPDYFSAVRDKISELKRRYTEEDGHRCTAMLLGLIHGNLLPIAEKEGLAPFIAQPSPIYCGRVGTAVTLEDSYETTFWLKGVGGDTTKELEFAIGDMPDLLYRGFLKMFEQVMEKAVGMICSGTNVGIEGTEYEQKHLPMRQARHPRQYLIGPLVPKWFMNALEDPNAQLSHLDRTSTSLPPSAHDCLIFLEQQPANSTLYVAIGSHADFSIEQATSAIAVFRRLRIPYVFLKRERSKELLATIQRDPAYHEDEGVITDWAPQLEVLSHPYLHLFLSHAGFGSMIEGVLAGQPFITCPTASDQFIDSKVLDHLGISLGQVAINMHRMQVERKDLCPVLPEDFEARLEGLLMRLCTTDEGERELQQARQNALKLRKRVMDSSSREAAHDLEELKMALLQGPA